MLRFLVFCTLVAMSSALFFGNSCGGGGGGGCGGGCGGCRSPCRTKRDLSLLQPHLRTSVESPCTQAEWKRIIEQALNNSSGISDGEYGIQEAMLQRFKGEKFFVFCQSRAAENSRRFISSGDAYCSHGKDEVWCTVVAMYA